MSWDDIKITPDSVHEFFSEIDMNALTKNIDLILNEKNTDTKNDLDKNIIKKVDRSNFIYSANSYLSKEKKSLNNTPLKLMQQIENPFIIKCSINITNKNTMIYDHEMINKFNSAIKKETRNINYNSKSFDSVNIVNKNLKNKRAA